MKGISNKILKAIQPGSFPLQIIEEYGAKVLKNNINYINITKIMKNQKAFIAQLTISILILSGCISQKKPTQSINQNICSNEDTEQFYQSLEAVDNDKTVSLIYGLSDIINTISKTVSAERTTGLDNEIIGFNSTIGDKMELNYRSVSEIYTDPDQNKKESLLNRITFRFNYDTIVYSLVTDYYRENGDERTESAISSNREVFYYSEIHNGKTLKLEKNQEKSDKMFDRLKEYLENLGCVVEINRPDTKNNEPEGKQDYVCLRAEKERFTTNVRLEN